MLLAVGAQLVGCSNPAQRADSIAAEAGYRKLHLAGTPFTHVAYFKSPHRASSVLHVYIEHDGTPWITPTEPARDPTPRNPLMLRLMALDPAPALYLGRPCYFETAADAACEPMWWTHRRFSEAVAGSMKVALSKFIDQHREFSSLEFFGHSGGGVLATLLAPRFSASRRLVTLAAPLDLRAWSLLHGYTPLVGSLDPIREAALPDRIEQLHLAGAEDGNVPPFLIARFVESQPRARLQTIAGFSHYCCWEDIWAAIVRHE